MTSDALLLVGRETGRARSVMETHARRLVDRGAVDAAHVATYEVEPARELREQLADVDTDRVFAMPTSVAHTADTLEHLPGVLSDVDAELCYCEPLGRSQVLTELLAERAADAREGDVAATDASLVLVGLGSSGTPHSRSVVEHQAERLAERTAYSEVLTCYLVQNPAVECVRYNVTGDRAVAVPVFFADCTATRERIPEKLGVDRGGVDYAEPLGEHALVTDAVEAEVAKQRVLASPGPEPVSYEDSLVATSRRLAADGEGVGRER